MTTATAIPCPAWVADLKSQDVAESTGIWHLHPASSRAALAFAADGMKAVQPGDTLWLAGGGYVTVQKVTKALVYTTGGRFNRVTGQHWQGSD